MDELDQYIKTQLENRPYEAFDPKAWEALHPRLRTLQSKPGSFFSWRKGLIGLLGLFLGLGIGYLFFSQQASFLHKAGIIEPAGPDGTLGQFVPSDSGTSLTPVNPMPAWASAASSSESEISQTLVLTASASPSDRRASRTLLQRIGEQAPIQDIELAFSFSNRVRSLSELTQLLHPSIKAAPIALLSAEGSIAPHLSHKSLTFLLGPGWYSPLRKDLRQQAGYSIAATLDWALSPRFHLWGDVHWLKLSYQSSEMGLAVGIPVLNPPETRFKFLQAQVRRPVYLLSIGGQYHFIQKEKWSAYAGLGLGGSFFPEYEVEYEFEDEDEEEDYLDDEEIPARFHALHASVLKTGLRYRLASQIELHFSGQLRLPIGGGRENTFPMGGILLQARFTLPAFSRSALARPFRTGK